ncbi:ribosome-associated protein [Desulfonauticus submarinus]|uniref:Ribosomal silencing factor RsfS n=1 Tax=Desulfonauticus submarinus TaxID=206665 RepID=A0A1H0CW50_9BACT|nr:ribosome silencing factor [Desulfonauticus submarinus]SDN61881.1 ribosome-associated protein [Desulfonauticus submarinus]
MLKDKNKKKQMDFTEKLKLLGKCLEEKKAEDILLLDVQKFSSVFEGVIIATANNVRHAQSLADNLLQFIAEYNFEYFGMEGYKAGEWILLDLNDIVIHIFLQDVRMFYNLEGFWTEAKQIQL